MSESWDDVDAVELLSALGERDAQRIVDQTRGDDERATAMADCPRCQTPAGTPCRDTQDDEPHLARLLATVYMGDSDPDSQPGPRGTSGCR